MIARLPPRLRSRPDVDDPAATGLAQPREVAAHGYDRQHHAPFRCRRVARTSLHRRAPDRRSRSLRSPVIAGTQQHRVPPPFGPAANGRIYFDVGGSLVATNSDGSGRQTLGVGIAASGPFVSPEASRSRSSARIPRRSRARASWSPTRTDRMPTRSPATCCLARPTFNPSWSPDSTRIVFGADNRAISCCSSRTPMARVRASSATATRTGAQTRSGRPSGDWIAFIA